MDMDMDLRDRLRLMILYIMIPEGLMLSSKEML